MCMGVRTSIKVTFTCHIRRSLDEMDIINTTELSSDSDSIYVLLSYDNRTKYYIMYISFPGFINMHISNFLYKMLKMLKPIKYAKVATLCVMFAHSAMVLQVFCAIQRGHFPYFVADIWLLTLWSIRII